MKKEDIEFLRELQHELNTQEHDGQASPRFWGIEETYLETAIDGDGDPYIVPYDPLDSNSTETLEEYVSRIEDEIKELPEDTEDYQYILERWEILDKDDVDDVVDFVNDNLRTKRTKDVVVWMKECTRVSDQTGCFLTKRAAKQYLEKNYYHHDNGHTYAMTAWRNPEFEHLMNILQTMNIDDIKETE